MKLYKDICLNKHNDLHSSVNKQTGNFDGTFCWLWINFVVETKFFFSPLLFFLDTLFCYPFHFFLFLYWLHVASSCIFVLSKRNLNQTLFFKTRAHCKLLIWTVANCMNRQSLSFDSNKKDYIPQNCFLKCHVKKHRYCYSVKIRGINTNVC